MKLLFSEYKSDYSNYIFPYAICAIPEQNEQSADILDRGFLPGSYNLDRFYMCRHIRVKLADYAPSSENRRILRKGEGVSFSLVGSKDFELTKERQQFCKNYADVKFGRDVMTNEKLERLFSSPVCSHVMLFTDAGTRQEVGIVVLYLENPRAAFYYYAFYDLNHANKSLGMYMMTATVGLLQEAGFQHLYLGSCYSRNALYKTQFKGVQFWNGFRWSMDIEELKYLIDRDANDVDKHLLETKEYLEKFYPQGVDK